MVGMTGSELADMLDEVASQLITGVEEAMSPKAVALPLRRTIERLPGLMRDLVERLRSDRLDEKEHAVLHCVFLELGQRRIEIGTDDAFGSHHGFGLFGASAERRARLDAARVVGGADLECPPPQSMEYWNGLRANHVPTQFVVYPDEGHHFIQREHRLDVLSRTLSWFEQHMPPNEAAK